VYLVRIGSEAATAHADELYDQLTEQGIEALYDDRDERPGAKFADAELMGIPYRVTVSDRLIEVGQYEFTSRATGETVLLTRSELLAKLN
jgi:prolyl-tRNA synthetase